MKSGSNLEKVLAAGHFSVTGECGPPRGADPEHVLKKAAYVKDNVDACNVTDNQTSVVRMSSLAGCMLVKESGVEPLIQMVVRDRNRIALQSDLLGASALGVRNLLCLSGDHQKFGDDPKAKNVFDIDSMQLIHLAKTMRDEGTFPSGDELEGAPKFFIGCAVNPFADPYEIRVPRLKLKVEAGADFIWICKRIDCTADEEFWCPFEFITGGEGAFIPHGLCKMNELHRVNIKYVFCLRIIAEFLVIS